MTNAESRTDAPLPELPAQTPDDLAVAIEVLSDPDAVAAAAALADQSSPATVPALQRLAESPRPAVASAAIAALGRVSTPEAATALTVLGDQLRDKEHRKLARRALHHLIAAGIRPAAASAPALREPALRPEYRPYRGIASVIDGEGHRLMELALAEPAGSIVVLAALTKDGQSVLQFHDRRRGRRRFDEELRASLQQSEPIFVEVPAEYARFLLYEALTFAEREHLGVPIEIAPWHAVIVAGQPTYQRPLIYEHLDPAEMRWNPAYLEESPALLDVPEFDGWVLEPEQVTPFDAETEARQTRIVLPGESQRERADSAVDRAIAALFDAPARQRWRRRLEEMAYVVLRRGEERNARRALAAALALEAPAGAPLLGTAPARHPLLRALVEEAFDVRRREREQGLIRKGRLWVPRSAT